MSNEENPTMTPFDHAVEQHHLQIIKAAIPYIVTPGQKMISICVQVQELLNTITYYSKKSNNIGICSFGNDEANVSNMLDDIRKYCTDNEKETIDMVLNFLNVFQMYNTYKDTFGAEDGQDSSSSSSFDMLKGMLTPEQQSMIDTYSMLFQNL